jgi:hypothetical protein
MRVRPHTDALEVLSVGMGSLGLGLSLQVVFILMVLCWVRHGGEPHCQFLGDELQ